MCPTWRNRPAGSRWSVKFCQTAREDLRKISARFRKHGFLSVTRNHGCGLCKSGRFVPTDRNGLLKGKLLVSFLIQMVPVSLFLLIKLAALTRCNGLKWRSGSGRRFFEVSRHTCRELSAKSGIERRVSTGSGLRRFLSKFLANFSTGFSIAPLETLSATMAENFLEHIRNTRYSSS